MALTRKRSELWKPASKPVRRELIRFLTQRDVALKLSLMP